MARSRARGVLMALAMAALLAAMWAGLIRIGWRLPSLWPALPMAHGPLMVSGFLGTLIGLERAVALSALGQDRWERLWPYAAPLLAGLGAVALMAGIPGTAGPALMTLGSMGMAAILGLIVRRQPALFTVVMWLGALAWLVGNLLWLFGASIPSVVLWWTGFLVLTIAGERLELNRFLRPSRVGRALFLTATGLFLAGLIAAPFSLDAGMRVAGLGMLALAGWLLRYDIARRTVWQTGLARFIAACLLSGYAWLLMGGALAVIYGGVAAGPRYDAILHAVFLGFVFALIFGHAPIVFPAVLRLPVPFHPAFYGHLVLLHLSLALRVAGDLVLWPAGRQWGGMLNTVALLLFLANTGRAALGERGKTKERKAGRRTVDSA